MVPLPFKCHMVGQAAAEFEPFMCGQDKTSSLTGTSHRCGARGGSFVAYGSAKTQLLTQHVRHQPATGTTRCAFGSFLGYCSIFLKSDGMMYWDTETIERCTRIVVSKWLGTVFSHHVRWFDRMECHRGIPCPLTDVDVHGCAPISASQKWHLNQHSGLVAALLDIAYN